SSAFPIRPLQNPRFAGLHLWLTALVVAACSEPNSSPTGYIANPVATTTTTTSSTTPPPGGTVVVPDPLTPGTPTTPSGVTPTPNVPVTPPGVDTNPNQSIDPAGSGGMSTMEPEPCVDVEPPYDAEWPEATCALWAAETDACGEAWFANYCDVSCKRCTPSGGTPQPEPEVCEDKEPPPDPEW